MTDTDEDMVLCGRGLDKWYGAKHDRRQVLFGVDVDVRAGECLAVIGGSGSGKTTLTRVLLGLESADGGSVEYCGEPVRGDVARKLRMQSGLVFQSPFDSLNPRWRIGRSIGEPLRMHHPDWPRERVAERVAEVLEMVSLDPEMYLNRFPVDLSGGQTQRAAIARAIVDNCNTNFRSMMDYFTQDKIATLTAENQNLKFAASQDRQNALLTTVMSQQTDTILNRVNPRPIPAYQVANPNVGVNCCGCC